MSAKDQDVVVCCGKGVGAGPEGTHLLTQAGFRRAAHMKTGYGGWTAAGLPEQKG